MNLLGLAQVKPAHRRGARCDAKRPVMSAGAATLCQWAIQSQRALSKMEGSQALLAEWHPGIFYESEGDDGSVARQGVPYRKRRRWT